MILLVHLHLRLPLQQRDAFQLDVDVIDALVEEISSPFSNLKFRHRFNFMCCCIVIGSLRHGAVH